MNQNPDRPTPSPEDEIEEILREYRQKNRQEDNRPDSGRGFSAPDEDDDVRIAGDPESTIIYEPSSDGPRVDPTAHFESGPDDAPPSEPPAPEPFAYASHFTSDESAETPETDGAADETVGKKGKKKKKQESAENADDDEYAGLSKPTRVFLKIGKAFLSMSFLAKALIYIAVVLLVSAYLSYYVILFGNDMFALVTETREVEIDVPENATQEQVTALLKDNGLIESEWFFRMYLDRYASKNEDGIHFISGPHKMNLNMNYSQIMSALTVVVRDREIITLTFPEGYTVDQIIDLFVSNGIGSREGFVEAINRYPYRHEFVKLLDENGWPQDRVYRLEGYLYPDTYEFYTDTKEYLAINKMLNAFNDKVWVDWKSTYAEILADRFSLDDMVTLASIVEAEGKTPEDFEYISYVFHNRLIHPDKFPSLESDATIQYARMLAGLERIKDSSQLDVGFDSPYNTYKIKGLPPGAIGNAGLDAILATVYPAPPLDEDEKEIDAYYFVSNNAGKTYYANSLAKHEKNKEQVRKENEAAAAAAAGETDEQ